MPTPEGLLSDEELNSLEHQGNSPQLLSDEDLDKLEGKKINPPPNVKVVPPDDSWSNWLHEHTTIKSGQNEFDAIGS